MSTWTAAASRRDPAFSAALAGIMEVGWLELTSTGSLPWAIHRRALRMQGNTKADAIFLSTTRGSPPGMRNSVSGLVSCLKRLLQLLWLSRQRVSMPSSVTLKFCWSVTRFNTLTQTNKTTNLKQCLVPYRISHLHCWMQQPPWCWDRTPRDRSGTTEEAETQIRVNQRCTASTQICTHQLLYRGHMKSKKAFQAKLPAAGISEGSWFIRTLTWPWPRPASLTTRILSRAPESRSPEVLNSNTLITGPLVDRSRKTRRVRAALRPPWVQKADWCLVLVPPGTRPAHWPGSTLPLGGGLTEPVYAGQDAARGVSPIQEVSQRAMLQGLCAARPLRVLQPCRGW